MNAHTNSLVTHLLTLTISLSHSVDGTKIDLMDDIYHRVSHHGEDFKRCDFMFTPVVNSIMITCATEESGKRIKSSQLKTNPPEKVEVIPFSDLEDEIKKLQQKRFEVKHFDRKNHRINAIPSKATYELKHLLEKKGTDELPTNYLISPPQPPPKYSIENSSPSFIQSTSRPKSASILKKKSNPESTRQTLTPHPRRPQTNQPSSYLTSNRKVHFNANSDHEEATTTVTTTRNNNKTTTTNSKLTIQTNFSSTDNSQSNRKSPLKREESSGIDDSMLQGSDDSSDDGNEIFDTFNLKGVYLQKKRKALMGPSANNSNVNIENGRKSLLAQNKRYLSVSF